MENGYFWKQSLLQIFGIMKNLLLLLSLCLYFSGNSQKLIIDDSVTLQKGIYKNFDEFKFNSPSIPFTYELTTITKYEGTFQTGNSMLVYKINISEDEEKNLKKIRVFGFCDGENVYFNEYNKKLQSNTEFNKIQFIGLYSYFEGFLIRIYTSSNGMTYSTKTLIGKAININSGEIIDLTKSSLKSILENDEELLNRFKEEDDKKDKIREYIIEYSKRHKLDGIYYRGPITNEDMGNIIITRNECDTTDQAYIDRVYGKLKINPAFAEVRLHEEYYKDGQLKTIGIITKHDFISFEPITYRVGVWMSYYENGKPKEEIIYNITGSKLSSRKFDNEGNITK
jgi:hypothetical protein